MFGGAEEHTDFFQCQLGAEMLGMDMETMMKQNVIKNCWEWMRNDMTWLNYMRKQNETDDFCCGWSSEILGNRLYYSHRQESRID